MAFLVVLKTYDFSIGLETSLNRIPVVYVPLMVRQGLIVGFWIGLGVDYVVPESVQ